VDGRTKPDLVFPGVSILSAASSGNPQDLSEGASCEVANVSRGTMEISGTSMACPGIAGLAALVRQYYREINPATGRRGISNGPLADGKGPSASLLKATLINSARPLLGYYTYTDARTGMVVQRLVSESTRNRHIAGFGRPQLDNALFFADESSTTNESVRHFGKCLLVFDRHSLSTGDSPHLFTVVVGAGGWIKATLVYTDAPGPVTMAYETTAVQVNDLDLVMTCASGSKGCKQTESENGTELWTSASRVDNVEQVPTNDGIALFASGAILELRVMATQVVVGPQPYALVVSGMGLAMDESRSTVANWEPDWNAVASRPGLLHSAKRRAVLGGAIAGGVVGAVLLVILVLALLSLCRKGQQDESASPEEPSSVPLA
jgi:Subtilase family